MRKLEKLIIAPTHRVMHVGLRNPPSKERGFEGIIRQQWFQMTGCYSLLSKDSWPKYSSYHPQFVTEVLKMCLFNAIHLLGPI